jgi:IS5 family transposase
MLRIHFMQQWFALSDPAMEEALHDMAVFREAANITFR